MQERTIFRCSTVTELQSALKKELDKLQTETMEHSKTIGEKLRNTEIEDPKEMEEFKIALEGPKDPKKKQPVKKKESKQWKQIQELTIFDGIGVKGELEIYFKSLEELNKKLEKLKKISESLDSLVNQGFRRDIGVVALLGSDLSFRISFLKAVAPKTKFTYKSIFDVEAENPIVL